MMVDREGARVLVVDDEDDVREMLTLVLDLEGYRVTPVRTGTAALRAICEDRFELVTLDLRMPGLGGLETLGELRRLAPAVAVVVVSGYVSPTEEELCLALGASSVVRKPFTLDGLLGALRRARAAAPEAQGTPPSS